MKIKILKSSLALSLIAPLALQWATNMGNNPSGFADHIRCQVHNTLVHLHDNHAIPLTSEEFMLALIQDLVFHYGGEDAFSEVLHVSSESYVIETTFRVLGKKQVHHTFNTVYRDGRSSE